MIFQRVEIVQPQSTAPSNNPDEQTGNGSSDTAEGFADIRHGPAQDSDDVDSPSEDDESSDDEISEYKRIRLLDDGRMRWDLLTCAQELSISKAGLGVTFPGARTFIDPTVFAFARATPRSENAMGELDDLEMYFEVKIRRGDVCVGFSCADKMPYVATPGIDGVYAYCGNDGKVFTHLTPPRMTVRSSRPGDVVGCGRYGRTGYFCLNGTLICESRGQVNCNVWDNQSRSLLTRISGQFKIIQEHYRFSPYPIVGLKEGASVMANFRARPFLTRKITKATETSVGVSLPAPILVTRQFWVCCNCGDLTNAATSVECVSCHHGFSSGHCTLETH
jgi:hypothetical protein